MNIRRLLSWSPRRSLSSKLSIVILLLAVPIFTLSLGVLFTQSRHLIRAEAVGRANSVLSATMQRVNRHLMTIETATNANAWLVEQSTTAQALLFYTSYIVRLNLSIDGCSISTEPGVVEGYENQFSAYTIREGDSITSVIEEPYDYMHKLWYRTPRDLDGPCWVAYFDEADSLQVTLDGMLASYGRPLYDANKRFIGIISTDLSLIRLSRIISEVKPYPHSYFMMLNEEGRYFVHPDSTRLFRQTIFTGADPHEQSDLIALGHEMTTGKQGSMNVVIDGEPCVVCYQPMPGTSWSLAVVCPDSDVLAGYHRLTYIVVPLLIIGLLIIFVLCHRVVAHTIRPINQLLTKTQAIAAGNMEVHIPHSNRIDAVGRMQNSFASMLQSLNAHMGIVRYSTDLAQLRNEELAKATRLAEEADRQKTAFLQNVTHQIRTPLNIIMGFAQIFSDTAAASGGKGSLSDGLSEEEMKSITETMDHNSKLLNRMVLMLFDSSDSGLTEELNSQKHFRVSCNDVAREAISYNEQHYPNVPIHLESEVSNDFCIETSRVYLMRSLREILYNAAKYSDGEHVTLRITATDTVVRFIVEDKGKGIDEADRDVIFKFFSKADDLSEGLGLGIPLAKRHAQNLGGDLILDTTYHEGCRFIVEVPYK